MAYASNGDVVAEFKALSANGGFTTSTNPTSTQVDEWCTRASNFIDSKIGGKYATPVDSTASPRSFSLLKEICVWLVSGRVSQVVGIQSGDGKSSPNVGRLNFEEKAKNALEEIQKGSMKLNDAPLATSQDGVESYTDDNSATSQPPVFQKNQNNW